MSATRTLGGLRGLAAGARGGKGMSDVALQRSRLVSPADRRSTAVHESSHLVVMDTLDLVGPVGVRLAIGERVGDDRYLGVVESADPTRGPWRDLEDDDLPRRPPLLEYDTIVQAILWRNALVYYAGVAGQYHRCCGLTSAIAGSSRGDRLHYEQLAGAFGYEAPGFWYDAFDGACRIVDARWGAVLAIASELDACGELFSDEALEIARHAPERVNDLRSRWDPSRPEPLWDPARPADFPHELLRPLELTEVAAIAEAELPRAAAETAPL